MDLNPYQPPAAEAEAGKEARPTRLLATVTVIALGLLTLVGLPYEALAAMRRAPEHRSLAAVGSAFFAAVFAFGFLQALVRWAQRERDRGGTASGATTAIVLALLGALAATILAFGLWLGDRPY